MCGIAGIISEKAPIGRLLFETIKKLEYRGYDSYGFAFYSKGRNFIFKGLGSIPKSIFKFFPESNVGIAHTRWATHGKVSIENTHPHISQNMEIAVVHNGIIENFEELRNFLERKGFAFYSETDSEVIPKLIEFYLGENSDFLKAFKLAISRLKGDFAIIALYKGKLYASKRMLPLFVAKNGKTLFLASDLIALPSSASFAPLNDLEFVEVSDTIKFFDKNFNPIKKPFENMKRTNFSIKESSSHMVQEIGEIPKVVSNLLNNAELRSKILKARKILEDASLVFFTGCGTSLHAAELSTVFFTNSTFLPIALHARELKNFGRFISENTPVVALSQSGETADVLHAVKFAKSKNAKIVSIVNKPFSSLEFLSDITLNMHAGPEICVVATKTFIAEMLILSLLAGRKLDASLSEKISSIMPYFESVADKLAKLFHKENSAYLIGSNSAYIIAKEAALKLKETAYLHAEAFHSAELKHGPLALISENSKVVAFDFDNSAIESIEEAKARGAFVIAVAPKKHSACDIWIKIPKENPEIFSIIPFQLLAYKLAILKGINPDKPRNLAKSVTVR